MYDIFISYRRDGGYAMARLLYEHLKATGLKPFLDLEDLRSGQFNTKLYDSIEASDNFLLILPPNALDRCLDGGDWIRLEIEHAMKHKKNIIPVMMNGFVWPERLPESIDSLRYYNAVAMSREYFDASVARIIDMLDKRDGGNGASQHQQTRIENTYFTFDDKKEKRRLKIQQNLMKAFDKETYTRVVDSYDELYVLDVGSNVGDFIMDRIGYSEKMKLLIGLEYDGETVDAANSKYAQEGRIAFYKQNVEDDDLADAIEEILDSYDIPAFNVINISMLLLHLKSPFRLLKTLRKFLAKGGTVIIKDIDDGFNVAYPDEQGNFARVFDICAKNETSGYRHSGRQVYTLLKRSGYNSIKLEKAGLTTVNMDYDERSALFDTYFSFIIEDLEIMRAKYPSDKKIIENHEWYKEHYEELEEQFQDEALFFNLGFILYTARKE